MHREILLHFAGISKTETTEEYKTHIVDSNVHFNLAEETIFPEILTSQHTIYKQWLEHDEDTPIQL